MSVHFKTVADLVQRLEEQGVELEAARIEFDFRHATTETGEVPTKGLTWFIGVTTSDIGMLTIADLDGFRKVPEEVHVFEDTGAGLVYTCGPGSSCPPHTTFLKSFASQGEANFWMEEQIAESAVWAVFLDERNCDTYVKREHRWSGNYKGSREYPARFIAEYKTREEAEKDAASLLDKLYR